MIATLGRSLCRVPTAIIGTSSRSVNYFTNDPKVSSRTAPKKAGSIVFPPDSDQLPALPMEPRIYPDEMTNAKKKGKPGLVNTKRVLEFRGEEQVHNELYYDQYAIVAELGGMLAPKHYATIRHDINHHLNEDRFAVWRVEPPWYTRTRKSKGQKRGGGKGKIHHFLLPIRARRVLVEVGGYLSYTEAQSFLAPLADRMPFRCRFVSADDLRREKAEYEKLLANNQNPYTWEDLCRWNMLDSAKVMGPWDWYMRGKAR